MCTLVLIRYGRLCWCPTKPSDRRYAPGARHPLGPIDATPMVPRLPTRVLNLLKIKLLTNPNKFYITMNTNISIFLYVVLYCILILLYQRNPLENQRATNVLLQQEISELKYCKTLPVDLCEYNKKSHWLNPPLIKCMSISLGIHLPKSEQRITRRNRKFQNLGKIITKEPILLSLPVT